MSAGPGRATRATPRSPSTAASAGSAPTATDGTSRRGKFNAQGERVNGIWMASGAQAERYRQLLRMEMDGRIANLRTEVSHPLVVNNKKICAYRSDFEYDILDEDGRVIGDRVEDVKGMVLPEFVLKQRLFDALEPTPLSVIHVKGKRKHPEHPMRESSGAGWLHFYWNDKLP